MEGIPEIVFIDAIICTKKTMTYVNIHIYVHKILNENYTPKDNFHEKIQLKIYCISPRIKNSFMQHTSLILNYGQKTLNRS